MAEKAVGDECNDCKKEKRQTAKITARQFFLLVGFQMFWCAVRIVTITLEVGTQVAIKFLKPIRETSVGLVADFTIHQTVVEPPDRSVGVAEIDGNEFI